MNDAPREARSAAMPLLKAAPDAAQIAERLEDGPWRGLEIALMPADVADDAATQRAIEVVRATTEGLTLTAEAPVSWPSGAFVSVDKLTDEARACIVRSADFAAAIGSPVLTIHLYAPVSPEEFRTAPPLDDDAIQQFLRFYALTCLDRGVTPLIENVPPVLRMRVGGVFLSQIGGHWRDLRGWHARVPELRFTFDTSHAALFRNFATSYGSLFGIASDEELGLETYVEELAPALEVAHVSDAHGLLGEGLPIGSGELDLAPVMRRLGELCKFVVSEINEPDPARSPDMKAGYRLLERAFNEPSTGELARPPRRLPPESLDWATVLERRDPVPALLELQERFGGRRVLVTGGAGSIGRQLTTFLGGFRPERITVVDGTRGRAHRRPPRTRGGRARAHALRPRRRARHGPHRASRRRGAARRDLPPGRVQARGLGRALPRRVRRHEPPGELERPARRRPRGRGHRDRRVHGQGRARDELLRPDEAPDGAADRLLGPRGRRPARIRAARERARQRGQRVRAVPRSRRAQGCRSTVTDAGMVRYWISMAHSASLVAQSALLAAQGAQLTTADDATTLTVGELAERIWRNAGRSGSPAIDVVGIRPGEVMAEVLVGSGETLAAERYQGVTAIEGEIPTAAPSFALEHLPENGSREENRVAWNQALSRPGLLNPVAR